MEAALLLMKVSKGGFTWPAILDLEVDDFGDAVTAAQKLEERINKAS